MAKLTAQQSVNTRDLPELSSVNSNYNPITFQGAYEQGPNTFKFRSGVTEIDMPGNYEFVVGIVNAGAISQITVQKSGEQAYRITNVNALIENLYSDAADNAKLDIFPAQVFSGNDELNGSTFADILFAFNGADVVNGNSGNDQMDGGAGDDSLNGGDGNDEMNGGSGGGLDELLGGKGADKQTGGDGADTFFFVKLSDSTKGKAGRDTILDFSRAEGDTIDLFAIDAKRGDGNLNSKFKFIKKQDFDDVQSKKGELRYKVKDGDALLQGDVNGDGKADFSILVDGVSKLKHTDFEL